MYEICESYVEIEDEEYKVYGISGEGVRIEDVTTDKTEMQKLIEEINRLDVSPIHIMDIIEDFIV